MSAAGFLLCMLSIAGAGELSEPVTGVMYADDKSFACRPTLRLPSAELRSLLADPATPKAWRDEAETVLILRK